MGMSYAARRSELKVKTFDRISLNYKKSAQGRDKSPEDFSGVNPDSREEIYLKLLQESSILNTKEVFHGAPLFFKKKIGLKESGFIPRDTGNRVPLDSKSPPSTFRLRNCTGCSSSAHLLDTDSGDGPPCYKRISSEAIPSRRASRGDFKEPGGDKFQGEPPRCDVKDRGGDKFQNEAQRRNCRGHGGDKFHSEAPNRDFKNRGGDKFQNEAQRRDYMVQVSDKFHGEAPNRDFKDRASDKFHSEALNRDFKDRASDKFHSEALNRDFKDRGGDKFQNDAQAHHARKPEWKNVWNKASSVSMTSGGQPANYQGQQGQGISESKCYKDATKGHLKVTPKTEKPKELCTIFVVNGNVISLNGIGTEQFTNWFASVGQENLSDPVKRRTIYRKLDFTSFANREISLKLLEGRKFVIEGQKAGNSEKRVKHTFKLPEDMEVESLFLSRDNQGFLIIEKKVN